MWSASERASHPVYHALNLTLNVILIDGKQHGRGKRGHPCLAPKNGRTEAVLSPSNNVQHDASRLRWTGYGQASGNCVNSPTACFLEYHCDPVWSHWKQHTINDDPLHIFCAACLKCRRMTRGCNLKVLLPE